MKPYTRLELTMPGVTTPMYYEVDPAGAVYWLRSRPGGKIQKYRIEDPEMLAMIHRKVNKLEAQNDA